MITIDSARRLATVANIGNVNAIGTKPIKRANRLGPVQRLFAKSPPPSERTQLLLRQYVLDSQYMMDPVAAIQRLKKYAESDMGLERTHAVAELAYKHGEWTSRLGQSDQSLRMYATALESSYRFLFDDDLDLVRNAYDPQFRSITDIYNQSLEAIMRHLIKRGEFRSGQRIELETIDGKIEFVIQIPGRWRDEQIERFELVNDFQVTGLNNLYRTYGLGVPLIAVRKSVDKGEASVDSGFEAHYPPGLTLALTAFLKLGASTSRDPYATVSPESAPDSTLALFDPLEQTYVQMDGRLVPLESDITTPMARYLNDPLLNTNVFATLALINADFANDYEGLYMLEPYDPNKIPVVMIHGLWSSPVTWLEMFNDLRADREIRRNYQFWFCLYPTGQPWWESARQFRAQLESVRNKLQLPAPGIDPNLTFDQMILVGHSMGGLVARMQTIESGNDFWNLISDSSIENLKGDPETLQRLSDTFYFEPNYSVRRMITLATPHHGSEYANDATRWLGRKAISLPSMFTGDYARIIQSNRDVIRTASPLTTATSVDSLAPENPFFDCLNSARSSPRTTLHNIYGNVAQNSVKLKLGLVEEGDGIVSLESARIDGAASEIEIAASHSTIHQHPLAILEVKRILLENLVEAKTDWVSQEVLPVGGMLSPLEELSAELIPVGRDDSYTGKRR